VTAAGAGPGAARFGVMEPGVAGSEVPAWQGRTPGSRAGTW